MKKSFGQHYLKDERIAKKIVDIARLVLGDMVIEVGPGDGVLTRQIIKQINEDNLTLIEADRDLIAGLKHNFSRAKIIQYDAAQISFDALVLSREWKLVSNLPYNAGNAIIMNALSGLRPPIKMVVMLQKEVAQKVVAMPGEMSLLSVAVQLYTTPKKFFDVKPGSFVPAPSVMSSVLILDFDKKCANPESVIALAKKGFSSRRKQLHKNLSEAKIAPSQKIKETLRALDINPAVRAQELSISDWVALQNLL